MNDADNGQLGNSSSDSMVYLLKEGSVQGLKCCKGVREVRRCVISKSRDLRGSYLVLSASVRMCYV